MLFDVFKIYTWSRDVVCTSLKVVYLSFVLTDIGPKEFKLVYARMLANFLSFLWMCVFLYSHFTFCFILRLNTAKLFCSSLCIPWACFLIGRSNKCNTSSLRPSQKAGTIIEPSLQSRFVQHLSLCRGSL